MHIRHALFLCLLNTAALAATESLDAIVAWVDRTIITRSELDTRMAQIRAEHPDARRVNDQALRAQVLDHLITEQVQLQRAEDTGIRIDDLAINSAIADIARNNGVSVEALQISLEEKGVPFTLFREQVHHDLVFSKLYQRDIVSNITISEQELNHYLQSPEFQDQMGLAYAIRHILIALPSAPTPEAVADAERKANQLVQKINTGTDFTELAIENSQGPHALQGGDMGWKKAAELPTLFVEPLRHATPLKAIGPLRNSSGFHIVQLVERRIAPAQMPFEVHIRQLQLPTASEAQVATKDFAHYKPADLGWTSTDNLPPMLTATIASLEPGQVSTPIETAQGWQVIQLVARRPIGDLTPVLRQYAQRDLQHRKFEEKLSQWVAQLRAEAYVVVLEDSADVRAYPR